MPSKKKIRRLSKQERLDLLDHYQNKIIRDQFSVEARYWRDRQKQEPNTKGPSQWARQAESLARTYATIVLTSEMQAWDLIQSCEEAQRKTIQALKASEVVGDRKHALGVFTRSVDIYGIVFFEGKAGVKLLGEWQSLGIEATGGYPDAHDAYLSIGKALQKIGRPAAKSPVAIAADRKSSGHSYRAKESAEKWYAEIIKQARLSRTAHDSSRHEMSENALVYAIRLVLSTKWESSRAKDKHAIVEVLEELLLENYPKRHHRQIHQEIQTFTRP
jgi:hypothetical protein